MREDTKLHALIRELFIYLDTVEESDSGREFHPVYISCCRAMWNEKIEKLLAEMKQEIEPK